ncbi:MAG: glycosyltransferase family 4 protein [Candidatus Theseobacter exili]|nr:glycosyltransferase family 4 protein [Candidatus Theseobacter exili]
MKICMLTTSFPRSNTDSAGHFIFSLAKEIAKNNDLIVIAPGAFNTPGKEIISGIKIKRFCYMFPKSFQKIAYGDGIIPNLKKSLFIWLPIPFFIISFLFSAYRAARSCDIIHAHWIFSGFIGLIIRGKKPLVLSIRGSDLNMIQNHNLLKKISYTILLKADEIITVSEDLHNKVVNMGIPASKIHTVPNGIDFESFKPRSKDEAREKLNIPMNSRIVLYIGRLIPLKGIEYLIEAIKKIEKKNNLKVYLIGEGNYRHELEDQAKSIQNTIVFCGQQPPSLIPVWLNAADIFVLPSLSEGRPNVVLEALAIGIPVIATKVGGIPELIKDDLNGFLVPAKSSVSLAERLNLLLSDKTVMYKFKKNSRQILKDAGLSWKNSASQHLDIYNKAELKR